MYLCFFVFHVFYVFLQRDTSKIINIIKIIKLIKHHKNIVLEARAYVECIKCSSTFFIRKKGVDLYGFMKKLKTSNHIYIYIKKNIYLYIYIYIIYIYVRSLCRSFLALRSYKSCWCWRLGNRTNFSSSFVRRRCRGQSILSENLVPIVATPAVLAVGSRAKDTPLRSSPHALSLRNSTRKPILQQK